MYNVYDLGLMAEFVLNEEQLLEYQNLIEEKKYLAARIYLAGGLEEYIFSNVIERSFALWFYTVIDIPREMILKMRARQHKGGVS